MRQVALPFLCVFALGVGTPAQGAWEEPSCPTSPLIRDTAPRDQGADPVGPADWYINADRTIWAGAVPPGGWAQGGTLHSGRRTVKGQKTYWVRPRGARLVISGRRLDAEAPPGEAYIPCCYPTGFQIVALYFPTEGCWEVNAKAGDSALQFVTRVRRGPTVSTR